MSQSSHYQTYLKAVTASSQPPPPSAASLPTRKPPTYSKFPPVQTYTFPNAQPTAGRSVSSPVTRSSPLTPASSIASIPAPPSPAPPKYTTPAPEPELELSRNITFVQISTALQAALTLQTTATALHDKRPFAALLLGPDNTTVLLSHFSISHVQHAESELARLASLHYNPAFLSTCTLVSTWEPCAMCSGTIYWSGIGRVIYAASETKLKDLTGNNNGENMTMSLPCRDVLRAGQRDIEIIGPVIQSGWEDKVVEESRKWWRDHQSAQPSIYGGSIGAGGGGTRYGGSRNGSMSIRSDGGRSSITATTWTGDENVLSSIGEDGEYKADLDIDWMR